jgi:hypothetical protein
LEDPSGPYTFFTMFWLPFSLTVRWYLGLFVHGQILAPGSRSSGLGFPVFSQKIQEPTHSWIFRCIAWIMIGITNYS